MSTAPVIGVIGLGLMGGSIAARLLSQGYVVHGHDPAPGAGEHLKASGLVLHGSIADLAAEVELVILSLPNGTISWAVCLGETGIRAAAGSRIRTIVDTTTTRPREAEQIAAELGDDIAFYDVGVSGSSTMIAGGVGLAIIGGPADPPRSVIAALEAICDHVTTIGGAGSGMRAKLAINMVLGLNRLALAEALVLGEKMGLDTQQLLDLLQRSAARSHAMSIWGQRMVDGHFDQPTSRISQHTKDVRQMLELGEEFEVPLMGASQLAMVARMGRAEGFLELDNSVMIEVVRMMAGLKSRVVDDD
jgi:3-hydroxyisobutyrate dehydrogenase-like beta-hydroxyacid dehydrogenase